MNAPLSKKMHTINDIYCVPSFFTNEEVDDFCNKHDVFSNNGWDDAKVLRGFKEKSHYDPSFRKTKVKTLRPSSTDYFLMKYVFGVVQANHKKFKKDIKSFLLEPLNLLKYTEDQDCFKMHTDNGGGLSMRQLSGIVHLSDETDYDGGGLVFYGNKRAEGGFRMQPKKGMLIVFPSEMFHEVRPVTRGARLSLVTWVG